MITRRNYQCGSISQKLTTIFDDSILNEINFFLDILFKLR